MKITLLVLIILSIHVLFVSSEEVQKNTELITLQDTIKHSSGEQYKEQRDEERTESKILLFTSVAILLLTIGIIFGLYRRYKFIQKTEKKLAVKNKRLNKLVKELYESNNDKKYLLRMINDETSKAYSYVISLLSPPIKKGNIRVNWKFVPSSNLGGDSLGYQWLDEDNFAFYILDVSGHGLEPAIHAVSILNMIRNKSLADTDFNKPDEVITSLNEIFQMQHYNNLYFTIIYAVFNKTDRTLTYCNAGHPPPLIISNNKYYFLNECNFVVGGIKEMEFNSTTVTLPEKVNIYLYSDGAYEINKEDDLYISTDEMAAYLFDEHSPKDTELEQWFSNIKKIDSNKELIDDFSIMKVTIDSES